MNEYFADLHIHIGRTENGSHVKISGSKDLTFRNIAHEASQRKGIQMVGIIDCHAPKVQEEIINYLDQGDMVEVEGGGIRYHQTTIILGSEIEVRDPGMGTAHLLAYLPTLNSMQSFSGWMSKHMRNIELSSQRIYVSAKTLQEEVIGRGGFLVPAHIFTPYKSIYGSCSTRMEHLLDLNKIAAVELGLSSDSQMAGLITELDPYTFVTNSDAHSLAKIGREYNAVAMKSANFNELSLALHRQAGRSVIANYGFNPKLGKYHRTYCAKCESILDESEAAVERCSYCGAARIVRGVMDRIIEISDRLEPRLPSHRPPYQYQVPLEFIPGIGSKKLDQMLIQFGTEMNIIHHVSYEQLDQFIGPDVANKIISARNGTLTLEVGGGGKYGKVK